VQTQSEIKAMLESRGLSPRHALGQNFLCDHNLIRRLVDAAGVGEGDRVLEVGPGTGALTEHLLERGCAVVACELDRGLADLLRERLGGRPGFTLIEGDCLLGKRGLNPAVVEALGTRPFTLVANLPYGAASPLLVTLLVDHPLCGAMHVTIQREVADRLRARVGTRDYGELGIIVQALAEVKKIATLAPECFWPRPKVTSEMVSVVRRAAPLTDDPRRLLDLCRRLFTQRRKQLGTILGRSTALPAGIEASQRPEQLSIERLEELARSLAAGAHHTPPTPAHRPR